MSDLQRHDNRVWDFFFDLLYSCDETISDPEVDADLQRAGIDMRPAVSRLQRMIEQKKARARFTQARDLRTSMIDKVRDVVAPHVQNLRDGVSELIDRVFTGPELIAHHHKLEKAATDEDLQSLMDDLSRLAALRENRDKDEPKAK